MVHSLQEQRDSIGSVGVAATGSTVSPVTSSGEPLALSEEFSDDPDAMFYLWKDHTATVEAQRFSSMCRQGMVDYAQLQGAYSSEWLWARLRMQDGEVQKYDRCKGLDRAV